MKRLTFSLLAFAWTLAGCFPVGPIPTPLGNPFPSTPTRSPLIVSPTPVLVYPTGSPSVTPSLTPSITPASATETITPSSAATDTVTPISTDTVAPSATDTVTPIPAAPTLIILGCNSSLDITHGMGEVTNAYVTIANPSGPNLTNVCSTLSSTDEGRPHPDKTVCAASLPAGQQVTIRLTIDTTFQAATTVQVNLTSDEGITASVIRKDCTDVGLFPPGSLGTPEPIP